MNELPMTKKDYDRSVWVSHFIGKVREFAESNQQISDILFNPVIKGYEITYKNNGVPEKLLVNSKSRFFKGLIVKKYADGKLKDKFLLKESEISADTINKILA